MLAARADDGAATRKRYRPHTTAGVYVPTASPAVPQWRHRKPWLMTSAAQFRPAPPPALTSSAWARDYNEVKALGGRRQPAHAEQTEIARFWEYSLPAIYHGVVQSVALPPGRDVVQNARLFAAMAQAMDDALISVFDAKYHYQFWRPSRRSATATSTATTPPSPTRPGRRSSTRRCTPSIRAATPSWPRRWARC